MDVVLYVLVKLVELGLKEDLGPGPGGDVMGGGSFPLEVIVLNLTLWGLT